MCLLSNPNFRRFVAILLLICLICAFMMCSVERASALDLVLTPAVIAVVGSALVACGFTFANSGEMSAVVQKCWNAIPTTVKSAFVELASSFSQVQADSPVGFITYKLSKAMVSSLSEWFASDVDSTGSVSVDYGGFPSSLGSYDFQFFVDSCVSSYSDSSVILSGVDLSSAGVSVGSIGGYDLRLVSFSNPNGISPAFYSDFFKIYYDSFSSGLQFQYFPYRCLPLIRDYGVFVFANNVFLGNDNKYNLSNINMTFNLANYADSLIGSLSCFNSVSNKTLTYSLCSDNSTYAILFQSVYKFIYDGNYDTGVTADVPCDLVYGPNSTADTKADVKTDVVVSGSLLNNGSLSDTAVGSMTTTGVRDATGAESSAQTGLLSGLLDLLKEILAAITSGFSSVLDWLKSMLQSLTDAISGVASAVVEGVKAIFIPSDFAWTDFINQVQALAPTSNVDFREYSNEIEIPDITMTSKWGTQTIVDNSAIRNNIGTIRKYLGAFLTALLIIFNANMVMKFLGMASFSNNDSRVPFAPSYPNSGGGSQQALPSPSRKGGN